MALFQRWLGEFCAAERLVNVAEAGSNSQISWEAVGWYPTPYGEFGSRVIPDTISRRVRAGSVTSEAYMRPAGRLASLPTSRCVHAAVAGFQSQTSARVK